MKLKNNLFQRIVFDNNNLEIKKFKKKWNKSLTTQGSEMEFFCDKEVNFDDFQKIDLRDFLEKNNCWIKNMKNKNLGFESPDPGEHFETISFLNFFWKKRKFFCSFIFGLILGYFPYCKNGVKNLFFESQFSRLRVFWSENNIMKSSVWSQKTFQNAGMMVVSF